MMAEGNPITDRLEILTEHWLDFTGQDVARMVRWVVPASDMQMVETFLAYEQGETGELPDLFLRFEAPFEEPGSYGFTLCRALDEQIAAAFEAERAATHGAAEPEEARWRVPPIEENGDDCQALGQALASLQSHYADVMEHAAAVLSPSHAPDVLAWQAWLLRLLNVQLPPTVRFLVLDRAEAPLLSSVMTTVSR